MKWFIIAVVALALAGCGSVTALQDHQPAHITFLHWNDFHSHDQPYPVMVQDSGQSATRRYTVGGSAALQSYLKHFGQGKLDVVAANAGDDFQGTPISELTHGKSQIELMNLLNPDVTTLGNHEFDYGCDSLRAFLRNAHYPILAANLYDSTTGTTFMPATLLRRVGNITVGFIGLLPPDLDILTLKGNLAGLRILDVDSVLSAAIPALKQQGAQLIVLLSHMGVDRDTALATRRRDIDIILGGHSHTPLFTPIKKGRTIIVQAGSQGRWLGTLDVDVDPAGDSVISYNGRLVETVTGVYPTDSTVVDLVARQAKLVSDQLEEVIGTITTTWKTELFRESNVGDWECDAIRKATGADVVFVNSGSIRIDIPEGPIRRRDLWELDPFNNALFRIVVDGRTLKQMLEWQANGSAEFMQVSGVRYTIDTKLPRGSRTKATVADHPISDSGQYSVVTNSYVIGHRDALLGLSDSVAAVDLKLHDRDILLDAITSQSPVHAVTDGRITVLKGTEKGGKRK